MGHSLDHVEICAFKVSVKMNQSILGGRRRLYADLCVIRQAVVRIGPDILILHRGLPRIVRDSILQTGRLNHVWLRWHGWRMLESEHLLDIERIVWQHILIASAEVVSVAEHQRPDFVVGDGQVLRIARRRSIVIISSTVSAFPLHLDV